MKKYAGSDIEADKQNIYTKRAIGHTIKKLRNVRGMASLDVAIDAGVHPSYYSLVENGHNYVSVYKLSQLCSALDVSLSDFFLLLENKEEYDIGHNQYIKNEKQ